MIFVGHNWGSLAQVGEESPYVYKWQAVLQEMIPKIKEILTEIYFKNFCTKLATDILLHYLDVIMKQRKINEIGTQQLLLDTYNVKTLLLQLESIGAGKIPIKHFFCDFFYIFYLLYACLF